MIGGNNINMDNSYGNTFVKKLDKIIVWIIAAVVLVIAAIIIAILLKPTNSGISLDEFNRIQNGMSYDEVVRIIGEQGNVLSDMDLGIGNEYATQMYEWHGGNGIATADIIFQGGTVVSKTQFGLQ
jgi:hypothetical protein